MAVVHGLNDFMIAQEVQIDGGFIASFNETHARLANKGERVFG